jgi:hypothetical protein
MEHNGSDKVRDFASQMSERVGSAKEQASEAARGQVSRPNDDRSRANTTNRTAG